MAGIRALRHILVFLLAASVAGGAGAREPDGPRQAIDRYDAAWAARDEAALGKLVAPGFVYFTSTGDEWSRSRWLAFMRSPAYTLEAARRTEIVVHPTGNAAIASTRWVGNGSFEGHPFHDDQRCSIAMARVAGSWRILSEHCTQISR